MQLRAARLLVLLLVPALLFVACGSDDDGGSGSGATTLNGSGSTFQKTFDEAAIAAFRETNSNVTVNYAGGGSGKGKTDLQSKTVDFAGTDSLIKPEEKSSYQGEVLYFPTVAAPITIAFNLSGVDELKLSAKTLTGMLSGDIKNWDDDAIAADNRGTDLPSTNVVIVHRADASGTTSNLTKYLTAAAPTDWALSSGDTVNWPADSQAGQGNAGVAQIVGQTEGAIGYVDYSDAVASNLKFASIKNASGAFVKPTLEAAGAAVANAKVNADLTYDPLNAKGADAYPITSPTWILVYASQTDKAKGQALKDFLTFILNEGQSLAESAQYAKLPGALKRQANDQLAELVIPA
jgi:phosphate transport system substrate-binding protein